MRRHINRRNESYPHSHPIILSPIRGGGDYRGIYDTGLKRGFMGYIGLLLNDPYKRDRIDGCLLDIFRIVSIFCLETV
jgi:hypothetical protein